jgi:HAD superfamily hydrolase (TIGR01549 family)
MRVAMQPLAARNHSTLSRSKETSPMDAIPAGPPETMPTAVVDIDGTLVDSNYQHVIAWSRAFARAGEYPPLREIHLHMGMGGDQLVASVAGDEFEAAHGDLVRDAEKELYEELMPEVRAIEGAGRMVESLSGAGWSVVLSSSAKAAEVDHYVELLGAGPHADGRTDSEDVEETKPSPDLIESALGKVEDVGDAIMIGDSVWDIEAAARAGVPAVAVLTGGFPEGTLRDAGAVEVLDSVAEITPESLSRLLSSASAR